MKWKKFTLKTTTEAVELVSVMLAELGIDAVEIEDNRPISEEDRKRMFIDILPELPPDEGTAFVSFYLEEEEAAEGLLIAIRDGLAELDLFVDTGEKTITVSETEDTDWIDNWKEFFHPFRVDDTIIIKPTWETLDEKRDGDMVIEIDPGTAFGTGSHETTKLCILSLKKQIKGGEKVLDLGCGSGILSIAARKLGASYVLGTDIDENAVLVSKENTEQNHLDSMVSLTLPGADLAADKEVFSAAENGCGYFCCNVLSGECETALLGISYDIVVANILADVIVPLAGIVGSFLKPDGIFISSGIIYTKAEEVKEALLANQFEIMEQTKMGDWVSYTARRK